MDDQASAEAICHQLEGNPYVVAAVEKKERIRKASAPFTTSSLQQDASNKLGFQTKKTMQIAQQLYEGVDVKGHGTVGLVTYIRTDSVRISDDARKAAADFIRTAMGAEYLADNRYTNKKRMFRMPMKPFAPVILN